MKQYVFQNSQNLFLHHRLTFIKVDVKRIYEEAAPDAAVKKNVQISHDMTDFPIQHGA